MNIIFFFFFTNEYFEDNGLNEMIYFFNTLYINVDWLFSNDKNYKLSPL